MPDGQQFANDTNQLSTLLQKMETEKVTCNKADFLYCLPFNPGSNSEL